VVLASCLALDDLSIKVQERTPTVFVSECISRLHLFRVWFSSFLERTIRHYGENCLGLEVGDIKFSWLEIKVDLRLWVSS